MTSNFDKVIACSPKNGSGMRGYGAASIVELQTIDDEIHINCDRDVIRAVTIETKECAQYRTNWLQNRKDSKVVTLRCARRDRQIQQKY